MRRRIDNEAIDHVHKLVAATKSFLEEVNVIMNGAHQGRTFPVITGSKMMCFGLTLLRQHPEGIHRKAWLKEFRQIGYPESSAIHAINDLVRRGLGRKSDDQKVYIVTEQGRNYSGKLIQLRPPKGDHKQSKLFADGG